VSTSSVHQAASPIPDEEGSRVVTLQDVEAGAPQGEQEDGDLDALRAAAAWITTFAARPNEELGRAGPVCPFVPGARERRTLWLAAERVADRPVLDVVPVISGYEQLFLRLEPATGGDADFKAMVVVFPDLAADRAGGFFGELLAHLQVPSYVDDGLVLGGFHERNDGSAVYNADFRPFRSPVPFLLVRRAVVGDWKFFLDDDEGLRRWAHRFGTAAVAALAEELRRLPWRAS
jgi:hypothetical protein